MTVFFINGFSGLTSAFGFVLCVVLDVTILPLMLTAGCPEKSMSKRLCVQAGYIILKCGCGATAP